MSSAAVLRYACRALRRPSSFPRALLAKEQQHVLPGSPMTREILCPRRLYSSDCAMKAEMNKHSLVHPHATLQNPGLKKHIAPEKKVTAEERMFLKLDDISRFYDEQLILLQRVKVALIEKNKREKRAKLRRAIFGASVFVGLAMYAKQHFFSSSDRGGQEDDS